MKGLVDKLVTDFPLIAMKLNVQLILVINQFDGERHLDEFTYEVASTAITLYQDDIPSDAKTEGLQILIGAISRVACLG